MLKIVNLVGARPQFIKSAGISRVIQSDPEIEEIYVHSGQHYDEEMSEQFFKELALPNPHHHLNGGNFSGQEQIEYLTTKFSILLEKLAPDALIVYGDTNTTLSGALAASHCGIPIAHVEAGLRSYNRSMPEEYNRVKTDRLAKWLFCPTPTSVLNLKKEGLLHTAWRKVIMCGDVQFDNIKHFGQQIDHAFVKKLTGGGKFALLTIHRNFNTDRMDRLIPLLSNIRQLCKEHGMRALMPTHPRLMHVIEENNEVAELVNSTEFIVVPPVSYGEVISLMHDSECVMTDSGGLTKEASLLGKKVLVLRTETEWTEWVDAGCAFVVDTELDEMRSAMDPARPPGHIPDEFQKPAAPIVVEAIKSDLL